MQKIVLKDRTYSSVAVFARHVEARWQVPYKTVRTWIYGRDRLMPEQVEARARAIYEATRSAPEEISIGPIVSENLNRGNTRDEITINGRSFTSEREFFKHLQRYCQISLAAPYKWKARGLSYEEILQKARLMKAQRFTGRAGSSGEVVVMGWRFRSLRALCQYYSFNLSPTKRQNFRYREDTVFHFFMQEFAPLWLNGYVNQYNRWPPEREAKLPKSCLPLNEVQEPITDELERSCYNNIASFRETRPSRAKARIRLSSDT